MTYEEFQHLARLYVVGALDPDETEQFCAGRKLFGRRAEDFLRECRKLNSIFALSLSPRDPAPSAKARLLARIRNAPQPEKRTPTEEKDTRARLSFFAFEARFAGRD